MSYIAIAIALFCIAMVYMGWIRSDVGDDIEDWLITVLVVAAVCAFWVITIPFALCVLSGRWLYRQGEKVREWRERREDR